MSDLHIHDVRIGLHHPVAHMQRGLKADLRFLNRHHGFFQAYLWVFHLNLLLQPGRIVLRRAHRVEGALQCAGESAVSSTGNLARRESWCQAGAHRRGHGGGCKSEFHMTVFPEKFRAD